MIFNVHKSENNGQSQLTLDLNRVHFANKCREVFELLAEGKHLKVLDCAIMGISSLPRRIKDLTDMGFSVSKYWDKGVIVYYFTELDVKFNQVVISKLQQNSEKKQ